MLKRRNLTPEQLYKIKKRTFIADIILIIVILGISFYVIINIEPIKKMQSGEFNPCYVCEKTISGASCSLKGDFVYWHENQIPDMNMTFNFSEYM